MTWHRIYFKQDFHHQISSDKRLLTGNFPFYKLLVAADKVKSRWLLLKCHYDENLDIRLFTFLCTTWSIPDILANFNLLQTLELVFFFSDLYFREFIFTVAINFPCFNSWMRIGENDIIFSKITLGLNIIITISTAIRMKNNKSEQKCKKLGIENLIIEVALKGRN